MMEGYIVPFILERQERGGDRQGHVDLVYLSFVFLNSELDSVLQVCYEALRKHTPFLLCVY